MNRVNRNIFASHLDVLIPIDTRAIFPTKNVELIGPLACIYQRRFNDARTAWIS